MDKLFGGQKQQIRESAKFSLRFCIAVTAASAFSLSFHPDHRFFGSLWVYVVASTVAWTPSPVIDVSSVLHGMLDQTYGAVVGAVLGLIPGYISMTVPEGVQRTAFLGVAIAVHGFCFPYVCDRLGLRGVRWAILSTPTYGITALAFFGPPLPGTRYDSGLYRLADVLLGGSIAAAAAVVVFPVSTYTNTKRKMRKHIEDTGASIESILSTSAKAFADPVRHKLPTMADVILGKPDPVYSLYTANLVRARTFKADRQMLQYDVYFQFVAMKNDKREKDRFVRHLVSSISRSYRVQMNAVMLESLVRSGMKYRHPPIDEDDDSSASPSLELLKEIGARCRIVLCATSAPDTDTRPSEAKRLLCEDLPRVRAILASLMKEFPGELRIDASKARELLSSSATGFPISLIGAKGEQTLLFFHLIEYLILRVAALYYHLEKYQPP